MISGLFIRNPFPAYLQSAQQDHMSVKQFGSRRLSHSEALNLSQQAAQYLQNSPSSNTPIPIPFVLHAESTESWTIYEKLLISCLRTGDDKSAHRCLEKLINRFGATDERIMGLRGLYQEAVAENQPALEKVLAEYEEILAEDPGIMVCAPLYRLGRYTC